MILDTDFLIDLMNGDEAAEKKAREMEIEHIPQRVPVFVVYELYVGIGAVQTTDQEWQKVKRIIGPRTMTEFEIDVAKRAGEIEGLLLREGKSIGAVDAMVGATAIQYEEPVLTKNRDHYERIPDVKIEMY